MIGTVDALAFAGPNLFGPAQTENELLSGPGAAGIDLTVAVTGRPLDYRLEAGNDGVAACAAEHPESVRGLARVDPNRPDAAAELRRCLETLRLSGLFLHPWEEVFQINDPRVGPVLRVAAESGCPVVVAAGHPWVSEPLQIADVACRHPETTFVLTNGGQFNISGLGQTDARLALERAANTVLTTTGVYRQDFIESVVGEFGAHRVMYAGGSPHFDRSYELLRVTEASLPPDDRDMLRAGTARAVFGL
ncbi:amidohydrolase family protein [Nonomuraea sp. B12E4]|uniref:amidohydrolase family protein n=1 Tax=Nonomuraea sp. B12E4 TaxID=3153564 RepID=UPI00325C57B3